MGNVENCTVALDTLKALVQDAVYLDSDAFHNATTLSQYQARIQLQQRRIRELEHEIEAFKTEVMNKDELLAAELRRTKLAAQQIAEMQESLDNNAAVFNMHYQELMARNEEISRLKAIIEGLDRS